MPTTPVGKLGAELIRHINTDTPAQIQPWAPGVLSASIAPVDKADFLANLASAARDSGGVDLFDAQTHPRQPGLLQMVARPGGYAAVALTSNQRPSQNWMLAEKIAVLIAAGSAKPDVRTTSGQPHLGTSD